MDVQNRVASVTGPAAGGGESPPASTLPKPTPILCSARDSYTLDGRYSHEFISNYLDVYVKDALKRVPGVGDVMIFGERKYAMRVWLDPVSLAARTLRRPTW